ncbi:conjugal transfer protein TraH [Halomonas sp. I5-271120]|uniref:conjugal transfer protein TraH n=1 Tax=Halomonas sp. I5-271120 TaxID=3061632 RepID=UPI002714E2FD|nr:conjugal transfer protein TraH [Halomonas sp. I5-271120]
MIRLKKLTLAVALGSALMGGTITANASMDDSLGGVFDSMMTNTTEPGAYESTRRGLLSGGRFSARTNIERANLAYIEPPAVSAGCGGIDIFGGSFSFVNKDQLIQLARSTAQNAAGLLFEVALKQMSAELADSVTKFLQKIQEMNDSMLDSCKMARGLMFHDEPNPLTDTAKAAAGVVTAGAGVFNDAFSGLNSGNEASESVDDGAAGEEVKKTQFGNPLWTAMQKSNVQPLWGSDTDGFMENILSLTGFEVYSGENTTEEGNVKPQIMPHTISLIDYVEGGNLQRYSCTDDECAEYDVANEDVEGLKDRIVKAFLGEDGKVGLIARIRLADGSGDVVDDAEIIMALPNSVSAILTSLAEKSEAGARAYINDNANALGLAGAYTLQKEFINKAKAAIAGSNHMYAENMANMVADAEARLNAEYRVAKDQYGSITGLIERGKMLLEATRNPYDGMLPGYE